MVCHNVFLWREVYLIDSVEFDEPYCVNEDGDGDGGTDRS